jgi:hypothetical protein
MNVSLLIDATVRQTTVLIAQLATSGGLRASLAPVANQVFLSLVRELKEQGLGNKLIADMFGLSLRTYHNTVRRLAESSTERGRSLWSAVYDYIRERGSASRADVLMRFARDDGATVRSVLGDLVESGLVAERVRGEVVSYDAAQPEPARSEPDDEAAGLQAATNLVWIAIARHSPIDHARLRDMVGLDEATLEHTIDVLTNDGRVTVSAGAHGMEYASTECVIACGEPVGWEAAVFDHYQAMVTAICSKLRRGAQSSTRGEWIGGSTYSFEIWANHPLRDEVLGFLQATRDRAANLRARVDTFNREARPAQEARMRVVAYVGQTVVDHDESVETSLS